MNAPSLSSSHDSRHYGHHVSQLPGEFVVMQGMTGDGLVNTMDTSPDFVQVSANASASASEQQQEEASSTAAYIQAWTTRCLHQATEDAVEWMQTAQQQQQMMPSSADTSKDALHKNPLIVLSSVSHRWWLHHARLRVLDELPVLSGVTQSTSTTTPLWPGTTVQGLELHTYDSNATGALNQVDNPALDNDNNNHDDNKWISRGVCTNVTENQPLPPAHCPHAGRIQFLKISYTTLSSTTTKTGFVVYSVDGYPFFWNPTLTCSSLMGCYKVVCADGAVVRQSPDLKSAPIRTLPYGSVVQVTHKVVNEAGLPRLALAAGGWCSASLNPLSGRRGPVLQAVPLPRPVQARVVLSQGAVVRQRVELSSPILQTLACTTTVNITSHGFTEFPSVDGQCVARWGLRAPGNGSTCSGAYVSQRLAGQGRAEIVQLVTDTVGRVLYDDTFDPQNAGMYHWKLHQTWSPPTPSPGSPAVTLSPASRTSTNTANQPQQGVCVCCLTQDANATLIHGDTGHICCCLECARLCQAQGLGCPLCRTPIERVILHFYS